MRQSRYASAAVGRMLFGHGRHWRVGLGCPGGAEHGDGRIRDDARDDPAHQREVIAEHLHERESGDRADDSAEREPDRDRGCKRPERRNPRLATGINTPSLAIMIG